MVRLRMMNHGGEDRLSSLPDSILIDILSRLPTNTAASTAVLSPRWQYLWTYITSIDINSRKFHSSVDIYADIDKVFQKLASPSIHSFTLRLCGRSYASEWLNDWSEHVNSWLHQICDRNVQKIRVKVIERDFKIMNIVTPSILFQTSTLVVLELGSELSCFVPDHAIKDDTTTNFNLPKLKKLSVTVSPSHCNFWGRLIKSCPSLENLSMVVHHILQPRPIFADILISAKKLERLNVELIGSKIIAKVTIDAPSLEYLSTCDSMLCRTNKPIPLREAVIITSNAPGMKISNIKEFLGSISNVSSLTLDITAFSFSTRLYPNLSHLRLNIHFANNEFKMLLLLLQLCPNLEVLVLSSTSSRNVGLIPSSYDFAAPLCLLTRFKRVEVEVNLPDYNEENLLDGIKYILICAQYLERLVCVFTKNVRRPMYDRGRELSFWEKLSKCGRSSARCQIEFSGLYIKVSTNSGND